MGCPLKSHSLLDPPVQFVSESFSGHTVSNPQPRWQLPIKGSSNMADGGGVWLCSAAGHAQPRVSANREVKQQEGTSQSGGSFKSREDVGSPAVDPDYQRNGELSWYNDCVD